MSDDAQPSIANLLILLTHPGSRAVGALGELLAMRMLERRGYQVKFAPARAKQGDLRVIMPSGEVLRIEVKTSRQGKNKAWQFCMNKEKKTSIANVDLVILLCVLPSAAVIPYVIPIAALTRSAKRLSITSEPSTYNGKYSQYRQRLQALNLEIE